MVLKDRAPGDTCMSPGKSTCNIGKINDINHNVLES